jgi:hypothetical protein
LKGTGQLHPHFDFRGFLAREELCGRVADEWLELRRVEFRPLLEKRINHRPLSCGFFRQPSAPHRHPAHPEIARAENFFLSEAGVLVWKKFGYARAH